MPELRDPLKSRSVRLQVSCLPDDVRRVQRLAKATRARSISQMAYELLIEALERRERQGERGVA